MKTNGEGMVLRIVIRPEGLVVRAYLAEPDTMDGARLLAVVAKAAIVDDAVFESFKDFVKMSVRKLTEDEGVTFHDVIEEPAAADERAGHA